MIAYFDCFSGISGDMTLGALIDLGVPAKWLKEALSSIPLSGFDLSVSSISRNGISAKRVQVNCETDTKSRDYSHIKALIEKSPLSSFVKERSLEVFKRLAEAEAGIHGCSIEKVHFHEVGGIDAIVDIVGTALCLEHLEIDRVIASTIPLGSGFVSCQHGILPVPAPATVALLKGVPVYGSEIQHELVTPTGAAIITTLAESFAKMPAMVIEKAGYGAGKREFEKIPNLLRIIIGSMPESLKDSQKGYLKDTTCVVETCIDDMNPEFFGFIMDRLFEDGALDVYWIPVFMKKNRPGTLVQVICPKDRMDSVIDRILSETSSLGVRYYDTDRRTLAREHTFVHTPYGEIQVKRITEPGGSVRIVPEYEVCKEIAIEKNIPIRVVYDTIIKSLSE